MTKSLRGRLKNWV